MIFFSNSFFFLL